MDKNMIGKVFGKLTVIDSGEDYIDQPSGNLIKTWICKCNCGKISKPILETNLISKYTLHCGCENTLNAKDMIGFESGYLTVIERAPDRILNNGGKESMWICYCNNCNRITKPILGSSLRKHHTRSCGCKIIESSTIHGGKYERLYSVYSGMKSRCNNENSASYNSYGGRGIKILEDFKDYSEFRKWALDNGYDPYSERGITTINRIDNDGPYTKENCNFVSIKEQSNNRRTNVIINYKGTDYTLSQFAETINIPYYIVYSRYKHGWNPEKIATTPILKNVSYIEYNGKSYTYDDLENMSGIDSSILYDRIHRLGWTVDKALSYPIKNNNLFIDGILSTKSNWDHVLGFSKNTISHRLSRGWSTEEAVFTPQINRPMNAIYFIDKNGNPISEEDQNKKEME